VLILGLPLVTILDRQEFVALVAHELAHTVNGDPNRAVFLHSAMDVLAGWYHFLDRGLFDLRMGGLVYLAQYPLKLVSVIPYMLGFAMIHLLWHDSQRAEYRADRLAAEVSSTDAFTSMLRKLGCDEPYHAIARDAALRWDIEKGDVFAEIRTYIEHMPEREVERVKRVQDLYEEKFPDVTHPSIARRLCALSAHRSITAKATCGLAEHEGILQELRVLEPEMQRTIIAMHLTRDEFYRMQGSI
jgi:heat shock protein HtpX